MMWQLSVVLRHARHKNNRHTAHQNDGFYAKTALDHLRLSDRQQKVGLTWMSDLDRLIQNTPVMVIFVDDKLDIEVCCKAAN